ncbi:MAG: trypsin-like serine protease [Dehalococcoidia bacterium]|nr:trypsin-like serine protease [Dehalococcoidia bacterium]
MKHLGLMPFVMALVPAVTLLLVSHEQPVGATVDAELEGAFFELREGPSPQATFVDAVAAALSRPGAASVFGADDRVQVADTTLPLMRTIAQLVLFDSSDKIRGLCTGTLLNHNVVLTAAHCLYDSEWGGPIPSVLVVPAENGRVFPFGTAVGRRFTVPQGWVDSAGALPSLYDFGLLFLEGNPFNSRLAPYFTVGAPTNAYLTPPRGLATAGYPGDKPPGTMWATKSTVYALDAGYVFSHLDEREGQSGSPIYTVTDPPTESFIVSVVSSGPKDETLPDSSPAVDVSVRFTPQILTALQSYCAKASCSIQTRTVDVPGSASPTATSTATPTSTTRAGRAPLQAGFNLTGGPLLADVAPAEWMACLPPDSWVALYMWDGARQSWTHFFNASQGIPAYVNGSQHGGLATIPRYAGVLLLMQRDVASPTFRDEPGRACG